MHENREALLRVEHLSQQFGGHLAVNDVSFQIRRGEVFGLVGESGCGKTTTGRCIIKLYPLTAGNIYFHGQRIAAGTANIQAEIKTLKKQLKNAAIPEKKALRERISSLRREIIVAKEDTRRAGVVTKIQMIFQDPMASLDPRMTVREIIAEGLSIGGLRDKQKMQQQVEEILELVGLRAEYADRYPHEFSGGQRQRIGIARAVIMNPELLIADEPISALDVSIQAQIMNLLNELREKMNLTVLFIAHNLSVVKYFSDRIGVMYYGKLVELAASDELFAHPLHPYTRSLLSAIPLPDPIAERKRRRIPYLPQTEHDYAVDKPSLREISPGHWVWCNAAEASRYQMERGFE